MLASVLGPIVFHRMDKKYYGSQWDPEIAVLSTLLKIFSFVKILSLIIHPRSISNLYEFLYSMEDAQKIYFTFFY